jgi:citrate synthase
MTLASRGLEDVVATQSAISSIIGATLTYRGITIEELAENASFEEVVYLLWYGALPTADQLRDFTTQLRENLTPPAEVVGFLQQFPKDALQMDVLRTAVSMLGLYDPDVTDPSRAANERKAIRLLAQMPALVTTFHRYREGKEAVAPRPDLDIAGNFLYQLHGKLPNDREQHIFNVALVLHADHELNASTFAARVTVATLSDIYSGVVSAIGTLKGPLHGGANEEVMAMLGAIPNVEGAVPYAEAELARGGKIMGIGHRVYKHGDPRAQILKSMALELSQAAGDTTDYDKASRIADYMASRPKPLLPNVDFYSGIVYNALSIPRDLFTPIFATSRVSGWIAHILEQLGDNRLIRPRAEYIGPQEAHWIPIEERGRSNN